MKKNKNYLQYDQRIINAFIVLSKKNKWSAPSITDIVKEANMTRPTFYLHFKSINDIYKRLEEQLIDKCMEFYSDDWRVRAENILQTSINLSNIIKDNEDMFRCFMSSVRFDNFIYQLTCKLCSILSNKKDVKVYYDKTLNDVGWWDWMKSFTIIHTQFYAYASMLKGDFEIDYDFLSYWCADLIYKNIYDTWVRLGMKIEKRDFLQEYIEFKKHKQ